MVARLKLKGIDGTRYLGGPLECDTEAGWVVEILKKNLDNLALPQTISTPIEF